MSKPQPISIGWEQIKRDYTIIQGNSGVISFSVNALQQNGTPYPSYSGFVIKFSLYTLSNKNVLTINNSSISYTHTAPSTLTITIPITSIDSLSLPANSDLIGDVMVIAPDTLEKQYPLKINLRVNQSFTR